MNKKAKSKSDLQDWSDLIHQQGEERRARREKYPEHAKYEDKSGYAETVKDFLDWLTGKWPHATTHPASHDINELAEDNRIKLACEFIGVDYDALLKEAKEIEGEDDT